MQELLAILEEVYMAKNQDILAGEKKQKSQVGSQVKKRKNSDNKVKSNCDNNRRNIDLFLMAT